LSSSRPSANVSSIIRSHRMGIHSATNRRSCYQSGCCSSQRP
jgi:hypothetical protein